MECICRETRSGYTKCETYRYTILNNSGYCSVMNNEGEEDVWLKSKFDKAFIDVEELKYLYSLLEGEKK